VGGGNKTKKLKSVVIISVVLAYEMQHNFFYAESLVHSRNNYNKIRTLVDSERVCSFVGRYRKKNLKCKLIEVEVWGRSLQPPEARGSRG